MYSDGLLKLPIFTIQKNFKILLTVYSLSPHFFLSLDMKKSACSTFPEKDKTGTFTGSIPLVMNLYVW